MATMPGANLAFVTRLAGATFRRAESNFRHDDMTAGPRGCGLIQRDLDGY